MFTEQRKTCKRLMREKKKRYHEKLIDEEENYKK